MIQILLIAVLSLLAQWVLPWWSLSIVAFVVCFWRSTSATKAFLCGFAGVSLVWLVYALLIHLRTDGLFTSRMSNLLFKTGNAIIPVLVTVILGGLVGGLASIAGFFVRQASGSQIPNHSVRRS